MQIHTDKVDKRKYLTFLSWGFFVFMMLYNLTNSSLWGDEWVEYDISQCGILDREMYYRIIGTFQPPLYNLVMHFWLLIDNSFLWFRLFNILVGVVSGIALFKTLSITTNRTVASFALIALGATYQWIYCIQECSEYALMLMFIFLALYYFVQQGVAYKRRYEILLIASCVLAMYSQYGAFLVIAPLLVIYFIQTIQTKNKQRIVRLSILYASALVFFAFPLYYLFARGQMKNHEVGSSLVLLDSPSETLMNFPVVFGKLISYFLNLQNTTIADIALAIIGLSILILAVVMLFKKQVHSSVKAIVIVLFSSYVVFFVLVALQVYAMVHVNMSAGYYSRYSYFFMPLFCVALPTLIFEGCKTVKKPSVKKVATTAICVVTLLAYFVSYPSLLRNWKKCYDKEFAEIWVNNAGFADTTILAGGCTDFGLDYYTKEYKFEQTGEIIYAEDVALDELPDSFWIWRSNWGGDMWQTIVDSAKEQGYEVTVYVNQTGPVRPEKNKYQLAYCTINSDR